MKSLNDRYSESQSSVYETFADLIFCALVVLVLFVMTLAIEVSQRVRSKVQAVANVEVVDDAQQLSAEEVVELSKKLKRQQLEMESQQREIRNLKSTAEDNSKLLKSKIAAINGEQRFTGATEPAKILLGYNYKDQTIVFLRRKEFEHATTRLGGETTLNFIGRQLEELVALALASRKQRFYTIAEANAIYSAFTKYQQINPASVGYSITSERLGVTYVNKLSGYIAGDTELSAVNEAKIERVMNSNFEDTRGDSDAMYPSANVTVLVNQRRIQIGGVSMSPRDFKDILLSCGGRGVMLDFDGYSDTAPDWLRKEVLEPTGYIGKTPKVPTE